MKEVWKDIDDFPNYQVSNLGRVRHVYPSGHVRMLSPYKKNRKNKADLLIVKLTTPEGKGMEKNMIGIVANAFLGKCPDGYVPVHKNGMKSDNFVGNIEYISRQECGKKYGGTSQRKPVAMIDKNGIIDVYSSARACARANYVSYQTVIDRCNGRVKSSFDGIDFAWDDSEISIRKAMERICKM